MKIGIDIGGSHIGLGLIDNNMKIILKKEHNWTKEEKIIFFESVEKYCKELVAELIKDSNAKIESIGIGYPSGNIVNGIIYKNGKELNLPKILFAEFNIPTYLKNDVKCSALCEKSIGNLKEYDNCLFMTLGTGIGGAYFYKNELVVPNKYQGFEIGHMIIEKDGKACKCGQNGCFEQYGSMKAFRNKIEELFNIETLTSHKLFEIIKTKEKEKEVNQIIEEYTDYLSLGLISLINIFEPDAICIGGSFSYYAPIFIDKISKRVQKRFPNKEIPDLLIAKYENDAGIIGASMLESN